MSYKLIKGEFHIHYPDRPSQGPEPDGDTLKFKPDNPALVNAIHKPGSLGPQFNGRMMINLRFEGIDALETHFSGMHQQMQWAEAARDFMLARVGFAHVKFFEPPGSPFKVQEVAPHPLRGYVLARTLDGHGRIVAFVYPGEVTAVDGANVFVDQALVADSVNAHLLLQGLAYPAFYTTLPIALNETLAHLAAAARQNNRGLWPAAHDQPGAWMTIPDLPTLQTLVMWPKLFRRLAGYFGAGNVGLDHFDAWMRADPVHRDDRLILPDRELGNMHDVIEIAGDRIRLRYQTEELIIVPDNEPLTTIPLPRPRRSGAVRIVSALVNPRGRDVGQEVVTLLNVSPHDVNLAGWTLADQANGRHPLDGLLAAGHVRQETLSGRMRLNNDGDTITLFDAADGLVDQVWYDKKLIQPEGGTIAF